MCPSLTNHNRKDKTATKASEKSKSDRTSSSKELKRGDSPAESIYKGKYLSVAQSTGTGKAVPQKKMGESSKGDIENLFSLEVIFGSFVCVVASDGYRSTLCSTRLYQGSSSKPQ